MKPVLNKILAHLSLFIPQSLLSTNYIVSRIGLLVDDPSTCDHEWYVVAGILSTVELQVQCRKCATYSEVPSPSKEEWDACYDAMENPYLWDDKMRIRFYFGDGKVH